MVCFTWHSLLIAHYKLTLWLVLVNNLHIHIKPMYRLYSILKDCEDPLTPDEIVIASGKKKIDARTEAEYIKILERTSENIKNTFDVQRPRAGVRENLLFILYMCLIKYPTGTMRPGEIRTTPNRMDRRL
jgi:hypothetical protein